MSELHPGEVMQGDPFRAAEDMMRAALAKLADPRVPLWLAIEEIIQAADLYAALRE